MKQRGINIRSWKAWRRANPTYCKSFPRIMAEEQIEKMRELIAKPELDKCHLVITFILILRISKRLPQIFASSLRLLLGVILWLATIHSPR